MVIVLRETAKYVVYLVIDTGSEKNPTNSCLDFYYVSHVSGDQMTNEVWPKSSTEQSVDLKI
jgi:hypothetical protein